MVAADAGVVLLPSAPLVLITNVVMYADPERDLSVCLMTSGKPFMAPGVLRWLSLLQLIARLVPRRVMGNSRSAA